MTPTCSTRTCGRRRSRRSASPTASASSSCGWRPSRCGSRISAEFCACTPAPAARVIDPRSGRRCHGTARFGRSDRARGRRPTGPQLGGGGRRRTGPDLVLPSRWSSSDPGPTGWRRSPSSRRLGCSVVVDCSGRSATSPVTGTGRGSGPHGRSPTWRGGCRVRRPRHTVGSPTWATPALDDAVAAVGRRKVGDRWAFNRAGGPTFRRWSRRRWRCGRWRPVCSRRPRSSERSSVSVVALFRAV